eukprot:TRINITY_DN29583_c0_g1_i1.p1 TRINITY_DN29583_c0_g1~~TRINITY_DN29583_c0_g1_i1.p1  ORF type:complete len:148 (-),score=58.92 TRINITY_DN29583_c0_g1_i1:253-696(-)
MAHGFTAEEVAEFKEAFSVFDKDRSGSIDKNELGAVLKNLGQVLSEKELKQTLDEIDLDGNGEVDFDEFVALMAKQAADATSADAIEEAFRVYDRDSKGFITADNLQFMMKSLGENFSDADIKDMILEADADEDGKISLADFTKLMR